MKFLKKLSVVLVSGLLFVACEKDNNDIEPEEKGKNGVYILNEGAWGKSNASISFLFYEQDSFKISNNLFQEANNRPLGDVLQSIYQQGDFVYMVMNSSNKIEVVIAEDFKEAGVIDELDSPRYMTTHNNKGFVSQWGQFGSSTDLVVVDMTTLEVTDTITVGTGAEDLMIVEEKLWVANSGAWGRDSTISIVNPNTNAVEKTITLGDAPVQMVDGGTHVWVLCSGAQVYDPLTYALIYESASKLVKVDKFDYSIETEVIIREHIHPTDLAILGSDLYVGSGYGFDGIYKMGINETSFPQTPFIAGSFYGMSVDNSNDLIFGLTAPSFTENGMAMIYDISGELLEEFEVGVGPNAAVSSN